VVAVRYRARIEAHWNGGNDRGLFWHTDIYERRNGRWQALVSGDADPGADLASGGVLLTSPGAPFPTRVPTACERRPAPSPQSERLPSRPPLAGSWQKRAL
jgi:hypothetical protein